MSRRTPRCHLAFAVMRAATCPGTDVRNWSEYLRHDHDIRSRCGFTLKEGALALAMPGVSISIFSRSSRGINPPFINPHLPKMYGVSRDLRPYLEEEDIPALLTWNRWSMREGANWGDVRSENSPVQKSVSTISKGRFGRKRRGDRALLAF
jgi:hypothetical protein